MAATCSGDVRKQIISARLTVHPELGAGIEVVFTAGRGYEVETIADEPGQVGIAPGDVIVAIGNRSVALSDEDEADEVLAEELNHGAELLLHRGVALAPGAADRTDHAASEELSDGAELLLHRGVAVASGAGDRTDDTESDCEDEEVLMLASPPSSPSPSSPPLHARDTNSSEPSTPVGASSSDRADAGCWNSIDDSMGDGDLLVDVPMPRSLLKPPAEPAAPSGDAATPAVALLGAAGEGQGTGASAVPTEADTSACPDACKVDGIDTWLLELRLSKYQQLASQWCSDMGAVSLDEIAENIDDFAEGVELKPIERQRVQKWAAARLSQIGAWPENIGSASSNRGNLSTQALAPARVTSSQNPPQVFIQQEVQHIRTDTVSMVMHEEDAASDVRFCEAMGNTSASATSAVLASRTVRLAMDSSGSTGLGLRWDENWGIVVDRIDPLPGQIGMREGDCIVAIDGCSLRHRAFDECDSIFSEALRNGAVLTLVTHDECEQHATGAAAGFGGSFSRLQRKGKGRGGTVQIEGMATNVSWQRTAGQAHRGFGGKGRRGGFDSGRMWSRFAKPMW